MESESLNVCIYDKAHYGITVGQQGRRTAKRLHVSSACARPPPCSLSLSTDMDAKE